MVCKVPSLSVIFWMFIPKKNERELKNSIFNKIGFYDCLQNVLCNKFKTENWDYCIILSRLLFETRGNIHMFGLGVKGMRL